MDDPLATQSGLLIRLRRPDDAEAWREFVSRYAPLVYRYARRHGLQDADAADLTQEVLQAVALALPGFEYDRRQGRFRSWLYAVARHHLLKFWRRAARSVPVAGTLDDRVGPAISSWQDDDFDSGMKNTTSNCFGPLLDWFETRCRPTHGMPFGRRRSREKRLKRWQKNWGCRSGPSTWRKAV
ncbi:MAG: sigma-70 family RNA polymerase sigma factor [Planctomycetes bacterium]|nr:sigma-70 family RNA polymerase sigma factor [Planctomycetota bacterium]